MNQSTNQPLPTIESLASSIKTFRRKHGVSLNQLSKLSGISRRTLTRIEAGFYSSHEPQATGRGSPVVRSRKGAGGPSAVRSRKGAGGPPVVRSRKSVGGPPVVRSRKGVGGPPVVRSRKGAGGPPAVRSSKSVGGRHLSPRIAYRLAQLLLPPDQARQTVHGQADPFDLINEVLDPYPAFLFHHAPYRLRQKFAQEFAPDYSGAFFRLILMPERNLAQRLRAFRLQHGFTLKDTAYLLDLSLSHLHALETGQRSPSPRTRFKLLRFLTLPFPNRDSSEEVRISSRVLSRDLSRLPRASQRGVLSRGLSRAKPRDTRSTVNSSEEVLRTRSASQLRLNALKTLLTIPPPEPIELADDSDRLHRLRYLWLTSTDSTRHLAARLGISQPHLIRLLRGDRRPSRSLRRRLELLTAPPHLSCLS